MTDAARKPDVEGDLNRYPIPRLMFYLYKREFLGEVDVRKEGSFSCRIYFRDGLPVYAHLPSSRDVLGRVLLERGLISEDAFNHSLQELAATKQLQGQILLRLNAIDQRGLVEGLRLQLYRKLNRLFTLAEGQVALYSGEHEVGSAGEAAMVRADPLRVIYHGVRNSYDAERMRPELEKLRGMVVSLRPGFDRTRARYGIGAEESALLALLSRSPLSVEQIYRVSNLGPLETQMLVYTLWVTEALVNVGATSRTGTSPVVAPPSLSASHPAVASQSARQPQHWQDAPQPRATHQAPSQQPPIIVGLSPLHAPAASSHDPAHDTTPGVEALAEAFTGEIVEDDVGALGPIPIPADEPLAPPIIVPAAPILIPPPAEEVEAAPAMPLSLGGPAGAVVPPSVSDPLVPPPLSVAPGPIVPPPLSVAPGPIVPPPLSAAPGPIVPPPLSALGPIVPPPLSAVPGPIVPPPIDAIPPASAIDAIPDAVVPPPIDAIPDAVVPPPLSERPRRSSIEAVVLGDQPRLTRPSQEALRTQRFPTGVQVSPIAVAEHVQLIRKAHERIQGQNHFEVLEVGRNCSAELVRDAYFKLAKIYHPDRCAALGLQEIIPLAQEVFRRINEAHTVLTNPEARKAYEEELDGKDRKGEVVAALEAEFLFQKGLVFFRKKNFAEALIHFQQSYEQNEKEGEHLAWVAWTMFNDPRSNRDKTLPKCKEMLLKSIKLSPQNPTCHYYLGEIYLALGDAKRAKTCFSRVVELQEHHVEANRHLRIMQMRRDKAQKDKGLFGRFRKK